MIFKSQNGRFGVDVSDPRLTRESFGYPKHAVLTGQARHRGTVAGVEVYAVDPAAPGYVVITQIDGLKSLADCDLVVSMGLQGSGYIGILNAREGALFRTTGYRDRSPAVWRLKGGQVVRLDGAEALEAVEAAKAASLARLAAKAEPAQSVRVGLLAERERLRARLAEVEALLIVNPD